MYRRETVRSCRKLATVATGLVAAGIGLPRLEDRAGVRGRRRNGRLQRRTERGADGHPLRLHAHERPPGGSVPVSRAASSRSRMPTSCTEPRALRKKRPCPRHAARAGPRGRRPAVPRQAPARHHSARNAAAATGSGYPRRGSRRRRAPAAAPTALRVLADPRRRRTSTGCRLRARGCASRCSPQPVCCGSTCCRIGRDAQQKSPSAATCILPVTNRNRCLATSVIIVSRCAVAGCSGSDVTRLW